MEKNKFTKPEYDIDMNPVDYWNFHATWKETLDDSCLFKTDTNVHAFKEDHAVLSFILHDTFLEVVGLNSFGFIKGKTYSKFMAFSKMHFQNHYRAAISFIEFSKMNAHIPYVRIGTDYFKVITKIDRFNIERKTLKAWKKEEIKQDHGAGLLKMVHHFDDFCINPDNTKHQISINGCYNMYAPFSHTPYSGDVVESDIPVSFGLMKHIFADQLDLGLKYMKVLFEMPRQALPILCLVSTERQTGKTTFLNWLSMIFGDNYTMINPQDLDSSFNSMYANKNIIAIDETVIDKSHATEKLKAIATQKMISVNQKHVANFMLPFFGKIVICTNKESDFAKIDEDEIRFWIRKIKTINEINTKIEEQLADEIPKFLKYLQQLPKVDTTKSRMVFTAEEIENENLDKVKRESWSWVRKEINILVGDYFASHEAIDYFEAAAVDIKQKFFSSNNNVTSSYIHKVLKEEMQMTPSDKIMRYVSISPMTSIDGTKTGKPFRFNREDFGYINAHQREIWEKIDDPF